MNKCDILFPFPRPSKSELRTLPGSTVNDQPGSSRDQPREVAGSCPSYSAMPSWDRGGRLTMVPCISANLPTVLVAFLHFSRGRHDLLVPPRLARCTRIGSLPPSQKNLRVKYKSTDDTLRRKWLWCHEVPKTKVMVLVVVLTCVHEGVHSAEGQWTRDRACKARAAHGDLSCRKPWAYRRALA